MDLGQLIVVAANGVERHRATPQVSDDQLTMSVPAAVLDTAAYPLTLDPTVTPETFVSPTPAPQNQAAANVASDGTNYLVVWRDDRSDPNGDIYGARYSPAGARMDGMMRPSWSSVTPAPLRYRAVQTPSAGSIERV